MTRRLHCTCQRPNPPFRTGSRAARLGRTAEPSVETIRGDGGTATGPPGHAHPMLDEVLPQVVTFTWARSGGEDTSSLPGKGSRPASRPRLSRRLAGPEMGSGKQDGHDRQADAQAHGIDQAAAAGRRPVKILEVTANNRRRAFEVRTRSQVFLFPYARLRVKPTPENRVADVQADPELGREAFTYLLEGGQEDSVHSR